MKSSSRSIYFLLSSYINIISKLFEKIKFHPYNFSYVYLFVDISSYWGLPVLQDLYYPNRGECFGKFQKSFSASQQTILSNSIILYVIISFKLIPTNIIAPFGECFVCAIPIIVPTAAV